MAAFVLMVCSQSHLLAGALQLDGVGDIVTFPATGIPSGSSPFTIEVWINPASIPTGGADGGQITFWGNQSANQANGFRLRGATGVRHYFWSNDHDENFPIDILPDNTGPSADGWHHLAITFDGTQTRWYWNGAQLGNPRTAAGVNVAAVNHRIGSRLGAEYFDGYIDELRIWNTARSATEISDNMGLPMTGTEPGLVAYWDFEGDFDDRAGGNNNGTPQDNASIEVSINAPIQAAGPRILSFSASPGPVIETGTLTFNWDIDTSNLEGTMTVQILDGSGGVLHTTGTATGSHGIVIPETSGAARTLTYTLRASDSGGAMTVVEESVEVTVWPLPLPPSDILLSSTSLGENLTLGSTAALFSSLDLNPGDTHSYTLVPGVGDTHNNLFGIDGNELIVGLDLAGLVGNVYSIRVRSTDGDDLFLERIFTLTVTEVSNDAVINEIHYNPPDNTVRQEFIEIHNPGLQVVDLTGWRLSAAVDYLFPAGTTIPPGGYLVVAEDPPTMLATFGVVALGPYTGNLDSEGETLRLRDTLDDVIDEVDYNVGFPWPVAADGNGPSIELIHPLLNNAHGSSWRASLPNGGPVGVPTPGAQNSVLADNAPPSIRQVDHSPGQPASTNQTVITALVTDPDLVASVTLEYQVVAPGAYIPSHLPHTVSSGRILNFDQPLPENPAYNNPANWTTVAMRDDGAGGDAIAGDNVFTVVLPAQPHRTLVRYRISVEDGLGHAARVPYPDDEALNFAYFVYDGVPDYNGHAAGTLTALPVYHVITRSQDWSECMAWNNSSLQIIQGGLDRFTYNWKGTMVYDGVVHDNIRYRLRGANGRYHQNGKRSMRFRFNDGDFLQARDQEGKPFGHKWRTLTTTKGFENRQTLTYALNEAINMYLWDELGLPAQKTLWVHWRVIDGAQEAPDPWRGDFWGLNFVVETYDIQFMQEHGLAKGSLYKLINQTRDAAQQIRYQGPFAPANGEDHNNIENNLVGSSSASFIRAHVNLEKYYLYHSFSEAIRNYDFWPDANKNMVYYFYPEYTAANGFRGQLWILPWDSDASWGPTWNEGHDVVYNSIFPANGGGSDGNSTPELWPEYYNAVRQLRDLLWQEDQILPIIDSFAATIADFIPADSDRWKGAPGDAGNYGSLGGAGIISLDALVQDLKNFAFVGGSWPGGGVGPGGRAAHLDNLDAVRGESSQIPGTPTITYVGSPGFPVDSLFFQSTPFSDPQGNTTFGAIEWRVAEIENTSAPGYVATGRPKLEWNATWTSGELTAFNNTISVPATALVPGATYRARVRHRDNSGRWSHWSAPIRFNPLAADILGDLQTSLVISEIMYNPPPAGGFLGDDLEWLELSNAGNTPLDLGGLSFSEGIDFTFPFGTSLAPGATVVLVRTASAFSAMNPGVLIGGEYDGKLDNGGETLTLIHPHGVTILSLTYEDRAPWPVTPDGFGFSLVRDGTTGTYRASTQPGGSPGQEDPASAIPPVRITEINPASTPPTLDAIELHNPGPDEADIGGWFLTDDPDIPQKFRIPDSTLLADGDYIVFDESDFNPTPGVGSSFSLSASGEQIYLFSGNGALQLTGYSHGFDFGGAPRDVTLGRHVNSIGEEQLPAQAAPTLGAPNAGPAISPVVLSEIHYNPEPGGLAYVELHNHSNDAVPLFDPGAPGNTWRINGLGFVFPAGITLDPGAFLLVVENDPAVFRAVHGVPAPVQILGPYPGGLQNDGERLELQATSPPDTNGFYYYAVDTVRYDDAPPWPQAADGSGASLHRIDPAQYADDPINWTAAIATPGSALPAGTPPSISAAPGSRAAVALTDVTFSVTASGPGPLRYQWRFNNDNIASGTNAMLLLTGVLPSDAGSYTVTIYNPYGSITSPEAQLSIQIPADIIEQPQGVKVWPGTNVTFSVTAFSSSPITYQWYRNGMTLAGKTGNSLNLANVQLEDEGDYTVVLTDAVGSIESQPARLTVLAPPVFVKSPLSMPVPIGGTLALGVETTGTLPMTYRWRFGFATLRHDFDIFSHISTLVIPNFQITNQGNYTVVATNEANFAPGVLSDRGTITVAVDADMDLIPDDYEALHGLDATDDADAEEDDDGDGVNNRDEYRSGTDPQDENSYLRIDEVAHSGAVSIRFRARAGISYTILKGEDPQGLWIKLADVVPASADADVTVIDADPSPLRRFYHLVTPVQ